MTLQPSTWIEYKNSRNQVSQKEQIHNTIMIKSLFFSKKRNYIYAKSCQMFDRNFTASIKDMKILIQL